MARRSNAMRPKDLVLGVAGFFSNAKQLLGTKELTEKGVTALRSFEEDVD